MEGKIPLSSFRGWQQKKGLLVASGLETANHQQDKYKIATLPCV
jgi:hypothetical protein